MAPSMKSVHISSVPRDGNVTLIKSPILSTKYSEGSWIVKCVRGGRRGAWHSIVRVNHQQVGVWHGLLAACLCGLQPLHQYGQVRRRGLHLKFIRGITNTNTLLTAQSIQNDLISTAAWAIGDYCWLCARVFRHGLGPNLGFSPYTGWMNKMSNNCGIIANICLFYVQFFHNS